MEKLPICQKSKFRISSLYRATSVVSIALINREKTMPKRITVLFDILLSSLEEQYITIKTVPMPKTKPVRGRVKKLIKGMVKPVRITRPAPKEAPEETPRIKGEARGFFSSDWKTAPLTARAPPVIKARTARGKRRFQTIVIILLSVSRGSFKIFSSSTLRVSAKGMTVLPRETPAQSINKAEAAAVINLRPSFMV
jgi:hypothetical protein